jgi:hypothetical protein
MPIPNSVPPRIQNRESERADDDRERRRARVLGIPGEKRLAERAHEAEPRTLEHDSEHRAEIEEDAARAVPGGKIHEGQQQERQEHDEPGDRLPARVGARREIRPTAAT